MKKLFSIVAALAALILASACVTTTVWDDTYPPEKSATVTFYQITVKSYNGIGVTGKWATVVIPAGEANIGGHVRIVHAGIPFFATDMEFACHFEAEKKYSLTGAVQDGKWGVMLYEGKSPDGVVPVFIPFKFQPDVFK